MAHGLNIWRSRCSFPQGILVNNAIKMTFRRIHVSPLITSFELMEVVLSICSVSLRLIVIYRMPPPK